MRAGPRPMQPEIRRSHVVRIPAHSQIEREVLESRRQAEPGRPSIVNVPQSFVHRSDTEAPTRELNIRCTSAATADTRAPAQPRPRVQSLARLPHGSARCTAFLLVRASLRRRR
jgi:hypothetical protein